MNDRILAEPNQVVRRFFALDTQTYQAGALDVKTKELLGLVASLVLRCDDCISYHVAQCKEAGREPRRAVRDLFGRAGGRRQHRDPAPAPRRRFPRPAGARRRGAAPFDVNGRGTLLTTEECLLSEVQARNPGLDRPALERIFADNLAARHVIWLNQGIVGDDTHGHVDDLARFVDPTTIVAVVEKNSKSDPNYELLQENWRRLRRRATRTASPSASSPLPMPAPVLFDGERLPASYANFYIANGLVLVPTFNDPADREALNTLATLFPDREVVRHPLRRPHPRPGDPALPLAAATCRPLT